MQGTHFSEEQMIRILHDAEATGNVRYAGHLYGVTWRSWPLCPSTCARAASACGNQKVMSMVRYRCMAMVSSACAHSTHPLWLYRVPRPRWQWAWSGRMPECFGQGEGLAVVGGSGLDLWGIVTRMELAEEP